MVGCCTGGDGLTFSMICDDVCIRLVGTEGMDGKDECRCLHDERILAGPPAKATHFR